MIEYILATGLEALVIPAIIAGATVQVVSAIQQGRAARTQARAQEAIAARNAKLTERQAESERQSAVAAAKKLAKEGKRFLARQRALFAVSGVEIGRGTPLSVVVNTAAELKAEELTILREGVISAAQRKGEADIFRLRGKAAKQKGRAASRAATLAAGGSILTGIGSVGIASKKGFKFPGQKGGLFGPKK